METQSGLFTQEDNERLEATYNYRRRIVEQAFADDRVPTSSKEIEAINTVLSAMDKSIYDRTNIKLKHQENQSREAILDMVGEALRMVSINKASIQPGVRELELSADLVPTEFVPGELEMQTQQVTLDEIMQGE